METETQGVESSAPSISPPRGMKDRWRQLDAGLRRRLLAFAASAAFLILLFHHALAGWLTLALEVNLHSHVLLIPFVSAYLIWIRKSHLPWSKVESSPQLAALTFILASIPWVAAGVWRLQGDSRISFLILSFVVFLLGGGFLFLGREWMAAILAPAAFLFFMVPLPDMAIQALERASQAASADAADLLFSVSGVPYLRDGMNFRLSNVNLEVAQECSGIRSSLVLLITGAFASDLLLRSTWRRWVLVLVVIPLGVLRNGFRIVTLGFLAVHVGPHILDSALHHGGGPIFFALSLIPLLAIVWWLRRGERPEVATLATSVADPPKGNGFSNPLR